jgi:hypothetical protein
MNLHPLLIKYGLSRSAGIILLLLIINPSIILAQPKRYSTRNAHSHNDYEQPKPFYTAYNARFGSIEADIFLLENNSRLVVAHSRSEIQQHTRFLDSLYLRPLDSAVQANKGFPYQDTSRSLQLLIDCKTAATPTVAALVQTRTLPRNNQREKNTHRDIRQSSRYIGL